MFKALSRIGALLSLTHFLKPRFRGLLISSLIIGAVFLVHNEYLAYAEITMDRSYLAHSFSAKWIAIALTIVGYLLAVERRIWRDSKVADYEIYPSTSQQSQLSGEDGYDFARKPRHLKTRGERLLSR